MAGDSPDAPRFEQILGVRFFHGTVVAAVQYITRIGGYTVVPAAPALANIQSDEEYRRALLNADLAIADSGFMVLLWRLLRWRNVTRISGLRYLKELFAQLANTSDARLFFIFPSEPAREKTLRWLHTQSFSITSVECYVAPIYVDCVDDAELVQRLNTTQPQHVIVAIGGGTQEKLGLFLRDHLDYRPAIHCIGAALGFLTGDQPPIPMWVDRFYLGWLLRVVRQPQRFARRYARAFALPGLIARYGRELPPLR